MLANFDVIIRKIQTISQAQDLFEPDIQLIAPERSSRCEHFNISERVRYCSCREASKLDGVSAPTIWQK
jgi:hypothetical protein